MIEAEKHEEKIASLEQLDSKAKTATEDLNRSSAYNTFWDGVLKVLKPALANLSDVRDAANKEIDQANALKTKFEGIYDSDISKQVENIFGPINAEITDLKKAMIKGETAFNLAKDGVPAAQKGLDDSKAKFNTSQMKL